MAFYNMSGTTAKAFTVGPNGVQLASSAVVNGKQFLTVKNQLDKDGNPLKIAYENDIYDAFIQSSDILSLTYSGNNLTVSLRNGNSVVIGSGTVQGPDSATDGGIAIFNGTSGKQIADSGAKIVDTIDGDAPTKDVPSVNAVVGFVGAFSDALKLRLEGKI